MGTPRIEKDGDDVTLPTRKGLALLAYLAMTQVAHSRQTLAALLWPESDTNLALGSLRQTLWQLRKNLKGEWLIADEEKVLLNSSVALWADATRFTETVAACSTHGHEQEEICSECVPLLEEAVALYQGDFLAGYSLQDSAPFDEWHFFQAEQMRRDLSGALEKLVVHQHREQAYLPAIDYARRWLALDSLHEPAHRALMRLYAESGQQAAAVRQYRLCVDTLHSELGVEPEPETQALYQAIRDGELSGTHGVAAFVPQPQTAQHNLPIQLTPFVGREKELAQIAQLLADPTCRLLTIVGLGGMGKTHLAIQAAFAQVANFADGVWFVPLASVNDPALLPSHIADLLKMPNMGGGDTESHLLRNLKEKSLLLVLDNFEHLLNAVGLIAHILAEAPGVKLLVTSRERLRLAEEFLLPLRGLSVPAPEESSQAQSGFDSLELFAQQARQLRPSFTVDSSNAADITQICRLVDGMPLGIKMAAVWLRVLSLPEIVAEIQQSLGFLTTDLRNVPEQHRSMQTVFDSSWRLLGREEQQLLGRLTLFANGFNRQAAQEVADATLAQLVQLVNSSWLQTGSEGRYQMHELVRQYAQAKLQKMPGEFERIRQLHSSYYSAAARRLDVQIGKAPTLAELSTDFDNLRLGWEWAVQERNVSEIAGYIAALTLLSDGRGFYQEFLQEFERVAELLRSLQESAASIQTAREISVNLARLLQHMALLAIRSSAGDRGFVLASESVGLLRKAVEHSPEYRGQLNEANYRKAQILAMQGRLPLAEETLQEISGDGDESGTPFALYLWGHIRHYQGRFQEADRLLDACIAKCSQTGDLYGQATAQDRRARILCDMGQIEEARRLAQESFDILTGFGSRIGRTSSALALVEVALVRKEYEKAERLLEECLVVASETGNENQRVRSLRRRAWLDRALGQIGDARQNCLEAYTLADKIGRYRERSYALIGLGQVTYEQGAFDEARRFLHEGLQDAWQMGAMPQVVWAVMNYAGLYIRSEDSGEVVRWLEVVISHPACPAHIRGEASALRAQVANEQILGNEGQFASKDPIVAMEQIVTLLLR